jgi:hypothetical protein
MGALKLLPTRTQGRVSTQNIQSSPYSFLTYQQRGNLVGALKLLPTRTQGRVSGQGCPRKVQPRWERVCTGPISPEAEGGDPRERAIIQPDHRKRAGAGPARRQALLG